MPVETVPDCPKLIAGDVSVDDRGAVTFVNGFDFAGVKRFYLVANHRAGLVRAWHAHRREAKYVTVVQGAAIVAAVQVDDWAHPSPDLTPVRHVLSAERPSLLFIPPGHANGFMSLTDGTKLLFFSTATVEESRTDDVRFDARLWDPWQVVER